MSDATMSGSELAELHRELRAVARDLLRRSAAKAGPDQTYPTVDWSLLVDTGWLGLEIPAELDGAGATFAEVAVVLHELGRAAASTPYLGTAVLAVGALCLLEAGAARDDLLRAVAAGGQRPALALPTGDGDSPVFRAVADGAGRVVVSGSADFVPDVPGADRILLLAADESGTPVVVAVRPTDPGVTVSERPVLDETRHLGTIVVEGTRVDPGAVWRFRGADPAASAASARRLLDRAALALACDSLGLAEAMLEATVEYAGTRRQFGRPIGSFQAVKHACADMYVKITVGRELLDAAVRALAAADDPAGPHDQEISVAVSRAKSYLGAAAVDIAGAAMQLHGGIGYTWEGGVHVYLKRALLGRSLFGAPAAHRARLAARFTAP
ncbi:acyl-CoA dehydrogenase [Frankia sp. R43]|uniref:acyl-CoA dehydrogenase family protein n=1 Tax=Frankia sp. R43 TaxID=269536 RepID=UPI0006C9F7B8|nr:acyl-CoA dehydrogenase family protein [Frankia sp. R43]KPM51082.1 acyl-CoA dehydrogenase [Frankia sp. R43]